MAIIWDCKYSNPNHNKHKEFNLPYVIRSVSHIHRVGINIVFTKIYPALLNTKLNQYNAETAQQNNGLDQ